MSESVTFGLPSERRAAVANDLEFWKGIFGGSSDIVEVMRGTIHVTCSGKELIWTCRMVFTEAEWDL